MTISVEQFDMWSIRQRIELLKNLYGYSKAHSDVLVSPYFPNWMFYLYLYVCKQCTKYVFEMIGNKQIVFMWVLMTVIIDFHIIDTLQVSSSAVFATFYPFKILPSMEILLFYLSESMLLVQTPSTTGQAPGERNLVGELVGRAI